ncbi:hypothetical protein AX17_005863 [Amanita inopinata Kibby_2008]|nr:hypothetical protein AX17_005863 [Amanita inopinata Kibby_2008]
MRNTLPLLSRSPLAEAPTQSNTNHKLTSNDNQGSIPSIRLISAAPFATGILSDASTSYNNSASFEGMSWSSVPSSVLVPRLESGPKRRLVPKKSKLNILNVVGSKDKENKRAHDFSGSVQRSAPTEAIGSQERSFEIYGDSTIDPEIGEVVVVKKQKSRAALDGLRWGPLGEVTNVPASKHAGDKAKGVAQNPALLKVKAEESGKWWSIGRGRKDLKDKSAKENKENKPQDNTKSRAKSPQPGIMPMRSKTPEPLKLNSDNRARFNSLDSGIMLTSPVTMAPPTVQVSAAEPEVTFSRSGTPTAGGLLAPPPAISGSRNQGSIALRAMRSVRSLARIGSWAQLKKDGGGHDEKTQDVGSENRKEKDVEGKKSKKGTKKEKKEKKERKEKERAEQTLRLSTSSFEAGHLSPLKDGVQTLGRKVSILGLGLPSSMRLPTMRGGSTASSVVSTALSNGATGPYPSVPRLSVENVAVGRGRSGSVLSSVSSLRPISMASSTSGVSSNSSSSVRWDENGLQTVKESRRREREEKAMSGREKEKNRESRRSSEGRRRTPLSDVFPETQSRRSSLSNAPSSQRSSIVQGPRYPIVTVEEATCDGHDAPEDDEPLRELPGTPLKKARPRPISEQLLGRSRPIGLCENEDGVLSILDAATNDLAQLIMTLNLEATPASSPNATPLRLTPNSADTTGVDESPTKRLVLSSNGLLGKTLRESTASVSSLRPYAQTLRRSGSQPSISPKIDRTLRQNPASAVNNVQIGQQIAPWSKLVEGLSPKKATPANSPRVKGRAKCSVSPAGTFRKTHRRQMTPAPEPDAAPVLQPLRPAMRPRNVSPTGQPTSVDSSVSSVELPRSEVKTGPARSSMTFGSPSIAINSVRKRSALSPSRKERANKVPIPPETRRILGMSGTMGGSDVPSIYAVPEVDASDPDSDIPDELQFILSGNSDGASIRSVDQDDTWTFPPVKTENRNGLSAVGKPSPTSLPVPQSVSAETSLMMDLPPVFRARAVSEGMTHTEIDECVQGSEEDTGNSFDFTGELKKLNESSGSDRKSFVEQLENAFRTPAKVDLKFGIVGKLLSADVPAIPRLPFALTKKKEAEQSNAASSISSGFDGNSEMYEVSKLVDVKEPTMMTETEPSAESKSAFDSCQLESQLVDVKEPTLLPGCDSLRSRITDEITPEVILEEQSLLSVSISTSSSRPSNGELNTSFKFGGLPKPSPVDSEKRQKPLTLSDIIPPASHVRTLSTHSMIEEDDSVLKSILAKAQDIPQPRPRFNSDSSSKRRARFSGRSFIAHSKQSSVASFCGLESFDEIRRGFEFSGPRPIFYPPPAATRRNAHRQQDSVYSIASVSSYGHVINPGINDPFDFGLPSLQERPSCEDVSSATFSFSVDDTFSFMHHGSRRMRVDSDASSFYFRPPMPNKPQHRGHGRHESNMSVMSAGAPPVSFYNRSFGTHRRNDSSTSTSSVAMSYAMHGASGGRAAWARHRADPSVDSVMSDMSALRLGRPGLGDKMFDMTFDQGMPLSAITASPMEPEHPSLLSAAPEYGKSSSYDSIMDDDELRTVEDSLFDKTGHRTSMSSDSVFGDDEGPPRVNGLFHPRYRPISMISTTSAHSLTKEDDTMISMIGGGYVRRRSIVSMIEASPCARVEKRKKKYFHPMESYEEEFFSPKKPRIVEKASISSNSPSQFGGERMVRATRGLLERQSLEDSCLVAEGEDMSGSFHSIPSFTKPIPAGRSRSSTCTSSSGGDTPPLSASDGSSISGGSQSSIDLAHLNSLLANVTYPVSNLAQTRARARARGRGHRRRYSAAQAARTSVYETIEEERSNVNSPARTVTSSSKSNSPTTVQPIFVVESNSSLADPSSPETSMWDVENGIVVLNKFFALRNEAEDTVIESKRQWVDTPFSVFAIQNFEPPRNPDGMRALLQHSVQNYGPLPSELRPRPRRRSRTYSRPSPYPQARVTKVFHSPEKARASTSPTFTQSMTAAAPAPSVPVLQDISANPNVPASPAVILGVQKPFATLEDVDQNKEFLKREPALGPNAIRPRVGSAARRAALGWTKRSAKSSTGDQKENKENISMGSIKTPGESLRLNRPRPRPRGRATPATQPRPIRV